MNIHHDRFHHDDVTVYTGHRVRDERGQAIGKITDVLYTDPDSSDDGTTEPHWLVVDPGVLRAKHYVPVIGSYRSTDGDVVVPWDKHWVQSAPKASGDHLLTTDRLVELESHYAGV